MIALDAPLPKQPGCEEDGLNKQALRVLVAQTAATSLSPARTFSHNRGVAPAARRGSAPSRPATHATCSCPTSAACQQPDSARRSCSRDDHAHVENGRSLRPRVGHGSPRHLWRRARRSGRGTIAGMFGADRGARVQSSPAANEFSRSRLRPRFELGHAERKCSLWSRRRARRPARLARGARARLPGTVFIGLSVTVPAVAITKASAPLVACSCLARALDSARAGHTHHGRRSPGCGLLTPH